MENTKERILLAALQLFARDGYAAVSVREIAEQLGITKGALYRHYPSKRGIFEAILARMAAGDAMQAQRYGLPEDTSERMPEAYHCITVKQIVDFSRAQFAYWTEDAFAAPFRRMLTLEQFRNAEMAALYGQYLSAGPIGYVTDLFAGIGLAQSEQKALRLYGAMHLMYAVYDGGEQAAACDLLEAYFCALEQELAEERSGKPKYKDERSAEN